MHIDEIMRIIKKVISEKCKTVEEMFNNNPITIANVLGVVNDGILMASRNGRCGNQSWWVEKVNNSFLHLKNVITGDKYDVYLLHLDSYQAEIRLRKVKEKPDSKVMDVFLNLKSKVDKAMEAFKRI